MIRALLLLGLLWLAITGDARAACNPQTLTCATREEAYDRAESNSLSGAGACTQGEEVAVQGNAFPGTAHTAYAKWRRCKNGTGWYSWFRPEVPGNPWWGWGVECPNGRQWDEDEKTCRLQCPAGQRENPQQPGTCMEDSDCLRRNEGNNPNAPRFSNSLASKCIGGCTFKATGPATCTTAFGNTVCSSGWEWGGVCDAPPPPPMDEPKTPEKEDECKQIGTTDVCVKPDGDKCVKGKRAMYCWKPGETDDKNNQDERATNDPGNQPKPPPQLPNGDTLTQTKPPVTTTQTTGDGRNIVTTVTVYQTTNGTNANGGRSGSGGTNGEGEEEGNGVSGGSCEGGYSTTGDPILGAILKEEHKQRCAGEKADKQMRDDAAAYGNEAGPDDGDPSSIWADTPGTPSMFNTGLINLGGASCPEFPAVTVAPGMTFQLPPEFCQIVQILGMLFVALAYAWGIQIVSRA